MNDKQIIFELHGFKVRKNSIYLVADKVDHDAPTAFQNIGVTKLPSEGVANTFHCPYKRISNTDGVWDSGFYELSPCYEGRSKAEVEVIVKGLMDNVVNPYRKAIGQEKALDQHNNQFFDTHSWTVSRDQVFNTDKPTDVVALYFALLNREVVPKDKKGDATFADADYMIIDINEKVKKRDSDASMKFQAIGVFEALYATDKTKLDRILYYLGKNMADDTKIEAYRGMFSDYLEAAPTNTETFNRIVEDSKTEIGRAKLDIYYSLKNKGIKNPKVTKSTSGTLYYEDIEIGVDLRSAAENIARNPKLADAKKEILFFNDDE